MTTINKEKLTMKKMKFQGKILKKLRKSKNLTLEQLAKKIGSCKSYIWELENKNPNISGSKLLSLAHVLNVPPSTFYSEIKCIE